MDLTDSFARVLPQTLRDKYVLLETRNAAAVLQASDPDRFADVVAVLEEFWMVDADLLVPGGQRGTIAVRLDAAFAARGWSAVRIDTRIELVGTTKAGAAGPGGERFLHRTVDNAGYEVDNLAGRVALDVEWNAKDGNLDRDLSAYRALYEHGLIDVGVIVTRDHHGVQELARRELGSEDAARRLGTTTTTNIEKLRGRMTRGDAGGCPTLAVGISRSTWAGPGVLAPAAPPRPRQPDMIEFELDEP